MILKLERIDNTFYENLLKLISEHGYTPKVVIRNTDCLSINGLKIISSKRQLFRHKEEIFVTSQIPCSRLTEYLTLAAVAKYPCKHGCLARCFAEIKNLTFWNCWQGIRGRYSVKSRYMTRFGEKTIFLTAGISLLILIKIRKKIEPDPVNPIYILTVWGIGYKFNEKIE